MYIYIYVYMYICIYVYMYVCIYIYNDLISSVCVYIYIIYDVTWSQRVIFTARHRGDFLLVFQRSTKDLRLERTKMNIIIQLDK